MYWYHGEDWPEKTSASAEKGGDVNLYISGGRWMKDTETEQEEQGEGQRKRHPEADGQGPCDLPQF